MRDNHHHQLNWNCFTLPSLQCKTSPDVPSSYRSHPFHPISIRHPSALFAQPLTPPRFLNSLISIVSNYWFHPLSSIHQEWSSHLTICLLELGSTTRSKTAAEMFRCTNRHQKHGLPENFTTHNHLDEGVWYMQYSFKWLKSHIFYMYQNWECLYWFLKSGLVCYQRARCQWLCQTRERWSWWFRIQQACCQTGSERKQTWLWTPDRLTFQELH